MKLRPETVIRRQAELQVSVKYAQEVRALKLRVAELEAQLECLRASRAGLIPEEQCRCSWCTFVRDAVETGRAQCAFSEFRKAEDASTEQVTLHPWG